MYSGMWCFENRPGNFQVKHVIGEDRGRLLFGVLAEFTRAEDARGFILRRYYGIPE